MLRRVVVFLLVVLVPVGTTFAGGQADGQAGEVELKWLAIGFEEQRDIPRVHELFNEELQEYLPGVTLDIEYEFYGEYDDRFQLAMAAGEKIDIANRMWMLDFQDTVRREAFLPLDDLLDEYGRGILDAVPNDEFKKTSYDGQIYNIPTTWLKDQRPGVFMHEDLYERANMEEPFEKIREEHELATREVYDLLEPYLELAADEDLVGGGVSPSFWYYVSRMGWEEIAPGIVIRSDGSDMTLRNFYETESFEAAIEVSREWAEKGYIREDYLGMDRTEMEQQDGLPLEDGGNLLWEHLYLEQGSERASERYGTPIVVEAMTDYAYNSAGASGNTVAIPSTSEHPEEAMQLLNLLYSEKDLYDLLVYGIEGEHWIDEGPRDFEPIGYDGSQGNAESAYGQMPWAKGNYMEFFRLPPSESGEQWEEENQRKQENHRQSPVIGWPIDREPVSTEIDQVRAEVEDTPESLLSGQLPPEEYEIFLDRLQRAGIEVIRDELQEQLDSWLESR